METSRYFSVFEMLERVTLPDGLKWIELYAQKLFPVYSQSGSLTDYMAILVNACRVPNLNCEFGLSGLVDDERGKWFVLRFGLNEDHHSVTEKFKEAFEAMNGD